MKKLLIAGSHGATTATSIVSEIKKRNLNWEIFFVGRKWADEASKTLSFEYKSLPEQKVKYFDIEAGKIENKLTRYSLSALIKIPYGFAKTLFVIRKINPDLVFSLGGAIGAMTCFWSYILRIPVILHEPTSTAGRANLFSSKFANLIALSRISSTKYFPAEKTVVTGNPISPEIKDFVEKTRNKSNVGTILITGGSRGSKWINDAIFPILDKLTSKFTIYHQTGNQDFQRFKDLKSKNYISFPQIEHGKMLEILSKSDIVISRAGANTVSELMTLGKPSILIPIPWSFLNEQMENALFMKNYGLATILGQDKLNSASLENEINNLVKKYPKIISSTKKFKDDLNGSKNIVDILESHLS